MKVPSTTILFYSKELKNADINFLKLTDFYGLSCKKINLTEVNITNNYLESIFKEDPICMAASITTLFDQHVDSRVVEILKPFLFSRNSKILLYDLAATDKISLTKIKKFTFDTIEGVKTEKCIPSNYSISNSLPDICREFSGLSFNYRNSKVTQSIIANDNNPLIKTIITIDKKPLYLFVKLNLAEIFILANEQTSNLECTTAEELYSVENFHILVPTMMFLRYVFSSVCWHSPKIYANFIIDDPSLKLDYGPLNYIKLLENMKKNNFNTTIAFIPWNYKRSTRKAVNIFLKNTDRLSIAVHGCDHTSREFSSNKNKIIENKICLALKRMKIHEELTGISFAPIMVFPQGFFTTETMKILKMYNFLAAVNSKIHSVNNIKKISDYLEPVTLDYEGFPLLQRRYPEKFEDFVLDAFIGKPILIVEHVKYFRDGYNKLNDIVRKINSIYGRIAWENLDTIGKNLHLRRIASNGTVEIKMYTNDLLITNDFEIPKNYLIYKRETGILPIKNVFVNEQKADFCKKDDLLLIEKNLLPGEKINIKVFYTNGVRYDQIKDKRSLRVWMRRSLCEFRDNYLLSNQICSKIVNIGSKIFSKL